MLVACPVCIVCIRLECRCTDTRDAPLQGLSVRVGMGFELEARPIFLLRLRLDLITYPSTYSGIITVTRRCCVDRWSLELQHLIASASPISRPHIMFS